MRACLEKLALETHLGKITGDKEYIISCYLEVDKKLQALVPKFAERMNSGLMPEWTYEIDYEDIYTFSLEELERRNQRNFGQKNPFNNVKLKYKSLNVNLVAYIFSNLIGEGNEEIQQKYSSIYESIMTNIYYKEF